MIRWIMIAMTLLGLIIALLTRSPGLLGFSLVLVFIGLFGTVFSLAGDRISANSRSDVTMLSPDVLKAIRDKANSQAPARAGTPATPAQHATRQPTTNQQV